MRPTFRLLLALIVIAPLAGACKKKSEDQGAGTGTSAGTDMGTGMGTGSDMGTAAGTGSDMAGTGSGTGAGTGSGEEPEGNLMSKKGGNCPNLVAGAITKVTIDQKKFQA